MTKERTIPAPAGGGSAGAGNDQAPTGVAPVVVSVEGERVFSPSVKRRTLWVSMNGADIELVEAVADLAHPAVSASRYIASPRSLAYLVPRYLRSLAHTNTMSNYRRIIKVADDHIVLYVQTMSFDHVIMFKKHKIIYYNKQLDKIISVRTDDELNDVFIAFFHAILRKFAKMFAIIATAFHLFRHDVLIPSLGVVMRLAEERGKADY